MQLDQFVKDFAELFDDTDADMIKATTVFHNLEEWSSLIGMGVIALAKTQYGKTITGKGLKECITVEDLFNLINSK